MSTSSRPSPFSGALGRTAGVAFVVTGCLGQIDPAAVDAHAAATNGNASAGADGGGAGAGSSPGTPSVAPWVVALGNPPDALANDDAHVYWTELNTVYRASKLADAPARERLFGEGTGPSRSVIADERYVYAVDTLTGTGRAWPKDGGAVRVVAPLASHATTFADDATNLYVARLDQGGIEVRSKATFEV